MWMSSTAVAQLQALVENVLSCPVKLVYAGPENP